jgi:arylsulfatase A-like enzyme
MTRSKLLIALIALLIGIPTFLYTVNYIGKQWEYDNTTSVGKLAGVSFRSAADIFKTAGTLAAGAVVAVIISSLPILLLKKNKTLTQKNLLRADLVLFVLLAVAFGVNRYMLHRANAPMYYRDYDSAGKLHEPEKYVSALKARKIILISIDTLAPKYLHCYGNPRETSPTLDQFAKEGVMFANCFSQSPKTSPSHMTMFTSLYPAAHKVRNWNTSRGGYALDHKVITLPEIMHHAGYATAAFTGGGNVDASIGFGSGFDSYDNHDQLWEKAAQWVGQNYEKPFFMFLHTFKVHSPYLPPPPYDTMFDPDYTGPILDSKEELDQEFAKTGNGAAFPGYHELFWSKINKSDPREVRHAVALYEGGIRHMDEQIFGKLIAKLKEMNIYDEALIIFTSDHGEEFGEHGDFLHKELYDEHIHVPLIIKFPKGENAGVVVNQQVRTIDLMPTMLEYVGLPAPENAQGVSILPAIDGEELELNVFAERIEILDTADKKKAIRMPQAKLIFWPTLGTHELFDLAADPGEHKNIYADSLETREPLQTEIEAWMKTNEEKGESIRNRQNNLDAQTIAKLRSLGYVK